MINYGGSLQNNHNDIQIGFPLLLNENVESPYSNLWIPQQIPQRPDASDMLPNMILNRPTSIYGDSLQSKPHILGFQQSNQWQGQPYMQFVEQPQAQPQLLSIKQDGWFNQIPGNMSSQLPRLSSEQINRVLTLYKGYKSMPANKGGTQDSFLNDVHLTECHELECNCSQYFALLQLFDNCDDGSCNICGPVRRIHNIGENHSESRKRKYSFSGDFCDREFDGTGADISFDNQPPMKRSKYENPILLADGISRKHLPELEHWPQDSVINTNIMMFDELCSPTEDPPSSNVTWADFIDNSPIFDLENADFSENLKQIEHTENQISNTIEASVLSEDLTIACKTRETKHSSVSKITSDANDILQVLNSDGGPVLFEEPTIGLKEQDRRVRSKIDQARSEAECDLLAPAADYDQGMKSEDPTIQSVSLVDFFTAEQMREHLYSFCQPIDQEVIGDRTHSDANMCQLCAKNKLVFAPTPIYCSSCCTRVKCNHVYYWTVDDVGTQYWFCSSCFRGSRGCNISLRGISISKLKLHKERHNEEREESWVQCDKCELWQHQICALYNDKSDLEGKAEYICPKCCLVEIEAGERVPLPKSAAFGAKDVPSSKLSDHIEQRLLRRLKQEREERAKALGKNLDEAAGAEDLVVRVVLSVEKNLKVTRQFRGIFPDKNFPEEFPYRSKVILLFQKIEGVDVCLFGMYVQEFGSECVPPNQRCVYISYLDSVKYFRPKTESVTDEALRTVVYHEVLIGYLDYCKKRGFVSCYLWACPPGKGEDYIFYCHPETQKTPKPDKLLSWYKTMLEKGIKDKVVVDCTNLYDHLFVPKGKKATKITAARLPYFDGGYWSTAAENISRKIEVESGEVQKNLDKLVTKRAFRSMGHDTTSSDAAKDIKVMQELGHAIFPVKENFIIVHLQFICMHCQEPILSGRRWFCRKCKNVQLCSRCINEKKAHTSKSGHKHLLSKVLVNDIPPDTEDKDAVIENKFLVNKDSFLSFCQSNNYQFDTLRRAKHSSMMILYQLQKLKATNYWSWTGHV